MPATLPQLVAAVDALLSAPGAAAVLQLNNNTRERAYEAYVFGLVVKAVRQAGGTVELRGAQSGPNPNPIVLRGAPGQMGSRAQDFCYAFCRLNQHAFEVHVGVQYEGGSGAAHEVDVSLYSHDAAERVRRRTGLVPKTGPLLGAIECKYYDSSLGTGLGRAFVGLIADCGTLRIKCFATNGTHAGLALYFTKGARPQPFFSLSPLFVDNAERFVRDVEQGLRQWAAVR